jgi:hypothetical protein
MLYRNEPREASRPTAVTMWVEQMCVSTLQCPFVTDAGDGQRAGTFRASKHQYMQKLFHLSILGTAMRRLERR